MFSRIPLLLLLTVFVSTCVSCDRRGTEEDTATEEPASTPAPVSEVALRILVEGQPSLSETLQIAWTTHSEQPIEVTSVESSELMEAAKKADVILFQSHRMGDLQEANVLSSLPDSFLESSAVNVGVYAPALLTDRMRWGVETFAFPLGEKLPRLWIAPALDAPDEVTWDTYRQLVEAAGPEAAAEPLSEGNAAGAFLARAASMTAGTWLFDRKTMVPVINEPPYVKALEDLLQDARGYSSSAQTPAAIWEDLADGKLKVAITWPDSSEELSTEQVAALNALRSLPYPSANEVYLGEWKKDMDAAVSLSLATTSLSAGLSTACRQTAVARSFLAWLADPQVQSSMSAKSPWFGPTRTAEDAGDSSLSLGSPLQRSYDQWVIEQLSQKAVRPSLRLPGADQYLAVLDERVRAALAGEVSAEEALSQIQTQWEAITEAQGREKQVRAWRLSQGLRAR